MTIESLIHKIEAHHHEVGAFLKFAEAAITSLRYTDYLHDPDVGKALDDIIKAIQKARPALDRRRTQGMGGRPGGGAYFGDELAELHKLTYQIETRLKIHQERLQADRKLDRVLPLEDPDERKRRRLELARAERLPLSVEIRQELHETIGAVVTAARRQPQLLPGDQPGALNTPPMTDRRADLRAALLENPDQPQAALVKLCRVHPNTVRRCRRELEEAGVIPFLAHRHAA